MIKAFLLNKIERRVLIVIGDLLIVFIALNLFINYAIDETFNTLFFEVFMFSFGLLFYLLLSYILDFYNLEKADRLGAILSQSFYITGFYVFSIFLLAIIVFDASFWRLPLLFFLCLTPVQVFLWRLLFKNTFRLIPTIKKVLYIYDIHNEEKKHTDVNFINGDDMYETYYRVKLTYDINKDTLEGKKAFANALNKIDACIINIRDYNNLPKDVEGVILKLIQEGKEVLPYTSFYENIYEALPIQSHNDSFYEILQLKNKKVRYFRLLFTIIVNTFFSCFIGFFLLLVIPFIWLLNIPLNRGPLFYTQKRVGKFGKEFKIYKFRSMVVDAENSGAKMATEGDPRITPFGKILRKTRLDELPQVLSIMSGNMAFIGPRPERKIFTDQLNSITSFYKIRHIIKPGITGWAQVKYKYGENLDDSLKKLEYDLYYIKNRSVNLDIRILFKTITTVLFSRGV